MKPSSRSKPTCRGVTLIEMTLVIAILMVMIGVGFTVSGVSKKAMLPKEASEALRTVYTAQRMYLSDHPLVSVTSLTDEMLIPYLPNQLKAIPTVESLEGDTLKIKVNQFPPVVVKGSSVYDPSGKSNDSQWDVGE